MTMTDPDPTLRAERLPEDTDRALRPQTLDDFIGQEEARANLRVFTESARLRGEAMDHVLFHGPPGLGKTTLAQIMARELGVNFRMTSGPVLAKAGDLAAILTNLDARDVLFIDEIHRLNSTVEEVLYPALEDFELDLVIGEGPAARTVRIELQPFTLIGATTRLGLLTTPLRDRFGIPTRLNFYTVEELDHIVRRGARLAGIEADPDGTMEIASRARGTPRIRRADRRELRRRAGGDRNDRRRTCRAARCLGGSDRTLPVAAGPDRAHATGPDAGAERVAAPRVAGAGKARSGRSVLSRPKYRLFRFRIAGNSDVPLTRSALRDRPSAPCPTPLPKILSCR
jgi:hypothetical protein